MILLDANVILRYLLNDNADMVKEVSDFFAKSKGFVRYEVLAEVVHVLSKLYTMPKSDISASLQAFINEPNVETESKAVLELALKTFGVINLDFVDCLLYAFRAVHGYEVFTLDKKTRN